MGAIGLVFLGALLAAAYAWLYRDWTNEQAALAALPGCRVTRTRPIGPPWLARFLGRTGFVLWRVRYVDASQTAISTAAPLAALTYLEGVDLCTTSVSDIRPLSHLQALEEVQVGGTQVRDLAPLSQLPRLRTLNAYNTPVSDLRPVSAMASLEVLEIGLTDVTDVRPLHRLKNLRTLEILGTPVEDLSSITQMGNLKELYVLRRDLGPDRVAELRRAMPRCTINAW